MMSPMFMALRMPRKKSRFISRPASISAWLSPPSCWKSSTRKPSKPELRSARRYSASYMLKRALVGDGHGFNLVPQSRQCGVHQLFVFPREPAEEDSGVLALRFREIV